MTRRFAPGSRAGSRRPSRLSGWLADKKIEEARQMKPEERLLLGLELSDFCLELKHSCSDKH